jgi:hypothetical protein
MNDDEIQLHSIEFPVLLSNEESTWGAIKKIHR